MLRITPFYARRPSYMWMVGEPPPLLTFTRHASQAVIPSPEELHTSIERTCARLASLSLCENTAGEQMGVGELFSGSELEEFSWRMRELCGSHLDRLRARAPDVHSERVRELATVAHVNRLVGGCWDKRLYQVYGVCHVLVDIHMIEGLLLGTVHHLGLGFVRTTCTGFGAGLDD